MGNEMKNYINQEYLSFIFGERTMNKGKPKVAGNQMHRNEGSGTRNHWFLPIVRLISC